MIPVLREGSAYLSRASSLVFPSRELRPSRSQSFYWTDYSVLRIVDPNLACRPLILFDGVCNLCNAAVQWVIERDPESVFGFASLQSEAGQSQISRALSASDHKELLLPDSIVLLDHHGLHTQSSAAIRIARQLGFPYSLAAAGFLFPRPLRDAVYRFIAKNRYRWFGRRDSCMMPAPGLESRFLDAHEPRAVIQPVAAPSNR
ncbi:MAG: putative DCC family thiol-disulfide oxidoreductase YuxK [Rhodothermales bacterium]